MTIKFKAIYLTKALWWLIIIGIIISTSIFLSLNIDLSYRYFFSVVIVFIGIIVVFYLNRNELERLDIDGEKIKLSYFNKVIFKRKPASYTKQDIDTKNINNDIIELLNNGKLIGVIRKKSLNLEDWEKVVTYFTLQPI